MNIYQAITGIISEVGAIGKEKKNQQQGFMYRGIDDVLNALQPLFAKHKIFIVPEVLEQIREDRQTARGGNLIYSICKVKYTFFAEDGSSISAVVIGEGMDSGDKATNKAMSVAMKYACFQVFCIPTEEMKDPDSESPEVVGKPQGKRKVAEGPPELITTAQAKRLFAIAGGKENAKIVKDVMLKHKYYKTDQIKVADYNAICKEIEDAVKAIPPSQG